ncbi:MAG: hypothetical protein JWP58_1079 [Hymenobacter sp.]|nr:hypothetical protein [Hymenobacter sp.]
MSGQWWTAFDDELRLYLDTAADAPPADAVLLVPSLSDVAIVTSLKGDRGWLYRTPLDLLRAVHVEQWLRKRGPVYFRPHGHAKFYKAQLVGPDE